MLRLVNDKCGIPLSVVGRLFHLLTHVSRLLCIIAAGSAYVCSPTIFSFLFMILYDYDGYVPDKGKPGR